MKTKTRIIFLTLLFAWSLLSSVGRSDVIGEREAVKVADLWYAMELNAEHTKMDSKEKAARLRNVADREVLYLVTKDEVVGKRPKGPVLAYIVKYQPSGFVVVSGEDRIEPILVFDVKSPFRYDQPERNFMPFYLATTLGGRWETLEMQIAGGQNPPVHSRWKELRSKVKACREISEASFGPRKAGRSVYVLWDTPPWDQWDPYYDTAVPHNGGHIVPTGCVATAMAIKMRYHQWPPTGQGSHSYDDDEGSVQYSHSVNFGAQSYDWSEAAMPPETLDPKKSYPEVADLMYHCGVAVEMDYEEDGSGADTDDAPAAMTDYFRYVGFKWNISHHETDLANSIIGGLPGLMRWPGHAMVADGYRDTAATYFHVNLGWSGGSNSWYNLDDVLGHEIAGTAPFGQPPNWVYVNPYYTGVEIGLLRLPFNTLYEGNGMIPSGGQLWLHSATYTGPGNVPIVFNKAMEIKPYNGIVVIQ